MPRPPNTGLNLKNKSESSLTSLLPCSAKYLLYVIASSRLNYSAGFVSYIVELGLLFGY